MGKKLWSRFQENTTAEVLGEADSQGRCPAYITDPNVGPDKFTGAVKLEEWSDTEVVPVPHTVPIFMSLAIYGTADEPTYSVFEKETDAVKFLSRRKDSIGYAPVVVQKFCMTPMS